MRWNNSLTICFVPTWVPLSILLKSRNFFSCHHSHLLYFPYTAMILAFFLTRNLPGPLGFLCAWWQVSPTANKHHMHTNHVLQWRSAAHTKGRIDSKAELLPEQIPWSGASPRRRLKWHAARACWAPWHSGLQITVWTEGRGHLELRLSKTRFCSSRLLREPSLLNPNTPIPGQILLCYSQVLQHALPAALHRGTGKNKQYLMVCLLQRVPIVLCLDTAAL